MNSENKMQLPTQTDVLVIGYGPVGAALSALLGRYGITTTVLDKVKDIVLMPRAIALDNEALRILQMIGLTEQSFERIVIPFVKMHCPYVGQFSQVNTTGNIDGHPKLVTFYQPDLEKALREKTAQYSCVNFYGGIELVGFTQDEQGVTAQVKDEEGTLHSIRTQYLIGADGASSKVRTLIGQDFEGQTYAEDWLIVDAGQRQGKAIDHIEFICNPKRPTPHMPAPGGRERWEFMLQPGESREEIEKVESVSQLLETWIKPEDLTIERKAVYRFHARCCERFQKGRVFLVGDAAHITPPFVGQGLVAGLRDAANLGWKLAWTIKGYASQSLLNSYDQERRPHAKKMIELAKFMGHLVMPRNAVSAVLIHGVMKLARAIPPLRSYLEELKIKPSNSFPEGFFITELFGGKFVRGAQVPQYTLQHQHETLLSDDLLGDGLTLVGFGVDPSTLLNNDMKQRWESVGGKYAQFNVDGKKSDQKKELSQLQKLSSQHRVAVVRPDCVIMDDCASGQITTMIGRCLALLNG